MTLSLAPSLVMYLRRFKVEISFLYRKNPKCLLNLTSPPPLPHS
ncbi:MAG: hypothetical protein ACI9ND_001856 [Yoonia sp.]|jgi:hypothetical protein